MRESRLIEQLQQQSPEGLQKLMDIYMGYVSTIIRNITRSVLTENDVEELTADVFLAVWQTADKLKPGKVRPYLAAIARNRARSRMRLHKENLPLEEAGLMEAADLQEEVEHTLLAETLRDTMRQLPEKDSEVLIRHYYYYQQIAEIAEEMQLTRSAVKVRLHRARKKLKELLIERGYTYETELL
ncbi:MAG: sigma-70 family RNA polymerase sigma factor [Ruminococcus sp.]|nr:sigma-70 family RNA polymerase sigma factor [Ruminococcus sp.]